MLKGCTMFCICFSSLCLFFFYISSRWFIRHTSWTSCERLRNVICIHGKNSQARNNLPVEHIHVNRTNVLKLSKTKARGTWEKRKKTTTHHEPGRTLIKTSNETRSHTCDKALYPGFLQLWLEFRLVLARPPFLFQIHLSSYGRSCFQICVSRETAGY